MATKLGVFEAYQRKSTLLDLVPPLEGPQTNYIYADADIVGYGGSAGGAKTYGTLLRPTRHISNPGFGATIFRRTMKQVKDEGGIWDDSMNLYPKVGANPNMTERFWTFPSGSVIQFAGLEHAGSERNFQGAQLCHIYFEELTHFLESQFWYMLSRNRSLCGVRPQVLATMNPEPGWVKRLFAPWVDRTFPHPAKYGETRWFIRKFNQIVWVDKPEDRGVCSDGPEGEKCLKDGCLKCFAPEKSITFIRATVYDNRPLLKANPEYISNLMAQDEIERKRLLDGDWDARPANAVIDAFDEKKHVCGWMETNLPGWRKYIFADFGDINGAELACAEEPETGRLWIIDECWPGHTRDFDKIADNMRRMCGNRTPDRAFGGNKTTEQGWRQSYKKEGIPIEEPDSKHTDPKLQFKCVNDAFRQGDLKVFSSCKLTIQMLVEFQRELDDNGKPTDSFDDSDFHLLSALRYGIVKLRPPKESGHVSAMETAKLMIERMGTASK